MGLKFNLNDKAWWAPCYGPIIYVQVTDIDLIHQADKVVVAYQIMTVPEGRTIDDWVQEDRLFEYAVDAWNCLIHDLEIQAQEELKQYEATKARIKKFQKSRNEDAGECPLVQFYKGPCRHTGDTCDDCEIAIRARDNWEKGEDRP